MAPTEHTAHGNEAEGHRASGRADAANDNAELNAASRLNVGVISAGRVGSILGASLIRAGHRVVATSANSQASRARAKKYLPGAELMNVCEVARCAQLLLICVPDDAIEPLVKELVDSGSLAPGTLIVHTCGAHGIDILAPAARIGCLTMALHPAMTFTGRDEDLDRLAGVSFACTSDEQLRVIAEALVLEMSGEPQFVSEEHRPLYHAALAHGANHLSTLVTESLDLLRDAGITEPERLIAPLLSAALDNTLRHGEAALTGPVVRGDAGTVASHLEALEKTAPDAVEAYLALARRTADRAIAARQLSPEDAEQLLGVLARRR
ncbi:Rossmann-like and DUF2520 domain-containing protein [Natronoglycomyces albus]|uniref:DUF2520 domain-containing protein n=1 Tax=Natronoglycomyces albus TaxID=2811108 RepID=A0A895XJG3_9ACTN|nr:DUF2520 domain-containing protein [Natronoglycomyces albus]QSB05137.1 DUF2520 domain-containing protein [Natronoglycomyces albus]